MKNLKAKAIMAKNKLDEMPTKVKAAWMCLLVTICPAYDWSEFYLNIHKYEVSTNWSERMVSNLGKFHYNI